MLIRSPIESSCAMLVFMRYNKLNLPTGNRAVLPLS
jgi:hypothetical protein